MPWHAAGRAGVRILTRRRRAADETAIARLDACQPFWISRHLARFDLDLDDVIGEAGGKLERGGPPDASDAALTASTNAMISVTAAVPMIIARGSVRRGFLTSPDA